MSLAAPVVLYGENGAGKTNVLEAVSLLSHWARPARRAFLRAYAAMVAPESGWTVSGRLHVGEAETMIGHRLAPDRDEAMTRRGAHQRRAGATRRARGLCPHGLADAGAV